MAPLPIFSLNPGNAHSVESRLASSISRSTLIIHGEKDPVISLEEARALRQGIRPSRLAILNCAHLACVEQPYRIR
jgi:pimeloyl-ACP methyl ester carboxylesterase